MTHSHPYAGAANERDAMFRRKLDNPEAASRRNPAVGEALAGVLSKLIAHDRDAAAEIHLAAVVRRNGWITSAPQIGSVLGGRRSAARLPGELSSIHRFKSQLNRS